MDDLPVRRGYMLGPAGVEGQLSTAMLVATLLSIATCVGLLGAASSAAAQAQAGRPLGQAGHGSEPAAQGGDRSPTPAAHVAPPVTRPETAATPSLDQKPGQLRPRSSSHPGTSAA